MKGPEGLYSRQLDGSASVQLSGPDFKTEFGAFAVRMTLIDASTSGFLAQRENQYTPMLKLWFPEDNKQLEIGPNGEYLFSCLSLDDFPLLRN